MGKDKRIIIPHRGRKWMVVGKMFPPFEDSGEGKLGCMLATLDGEKLLCHICGETFACLASHLRMYHNKDRKEYRDDHSLLDSQALTSPKLIEKKKRPLRPYCGTTFRDNPALGKRAREMSALNKRRVLSKRKIGFLNKRGTCPPQINDAFVVAAKKYQGDFGKVRVVDLPGPVASYLARHHGSFNGGKRNLFGIDGNSRTGIIWQNKGQIFDAIKRFIDLNGFFPRYIDFCSQNDLPSSTSFCRVFGNRSVVELQRSYHEWIQ